MRGSCFDLETAYIELIDPSTTKSVTPVTYLTGFDAPVTGPSARRLIAAFDEKGYSGHGPASQTIWVVYLHCVVNKIPFVLHGQIGAGLSIKRQEIPL